MEDSEGHREVPSQGFGELAKYPLPKPTNEPGNDEDSLADDLVSPLEMGVDEGKEVGHNGPLSSFGIEK